MDFNSVMGNIQTYASQTGQIVTSLSGAIGDVRAVLTPQTGPAVVTPVENVGGKVLENSQPMEEIMGENEGFFARMGSKFGLPVWSVITVTVLGGLLVLLVSYKIIRKVL